MRSITLTADDARAVSQPISLTRDEPYLITIGNKSSVAVVMTIATGGGDVPLIEIPGTGQISLTPQVVQALVEGRTYQYNIWQTDAQMVLFTGTLGIGNSIAPTGAPFATTFLNGFGASGNVASVVCLTQAQYDALTPKDPQTLYMITG